MSQRHAWTSPKDQVQAANKLKQVLTDEPLVLKYPHPTALFILATDASEYVIGGTLKQIIDGQTHYNYFQSRLLTSTEKNYSTIDREALTIFWCMDKLQQYLGGKNVMVHLDHKPLEQFHKKRKFNSKRIAEWLIKHQDVLPQIIEVKYRKGRDHGDADGMSRPQVNDQQPSLSIMTRSTTKTVVLRLIFNNIIIFASFQQGAIATAWACQQEAIATPWAGQQEAIATPGRVNKKLLPLLGRVNKKLLPRQGVSTRSYCHARACQQGAKMKKSSEYFP
ncbi:unnamed protein product [Didymodactylos carnosus]|uniref:Reverse transcriptase RNase H-like domain-containing protein n=2 Tax=Didymodactylos carnosus TaxID=1234261 RepID=A0A8S2PUG7_9BILA|nr:unnamed protein product [Didymodactylos carnosus]CAF4071670.1 unnamed protein product [Didymodactylos carnosus]